MTILNGSVPAIFALIIRYVKWLLGPIVELQGCIYEIVIKFTLDLEETLGSFKFGVMWLILKALQEHILARFSKQQVNGNELPNYCDGKHHPMDLGTSKECIYLTTDEFCGVASQIGQLARTYYGSDTVYGRAPAKLDNLLWRQLNNLPMCWQCRLNTYRGQPQWILCSLGKKCRCHGVGGTISQRAVLTRRSQEHNI